MRPTVEERFWALVWFEPTSGCWLWGGADAVNNGYGRFLANGFNWLAHRFSYTLLKGPIPEGLVIDHTCRNKMCVNPEHLRACSSKENTHAAGSVARAARQAQQTCCPKCGGPYTARPAYKRRHCVPCARALS
jgi:hypothetical protein